MGSRDLIANGFLGIYSLIPVCSDSVRQRPERKVLPEGMVLKNIADIYKAPENYSDLSV